METPPRAWGRLKAIWFGAMTCGNTPTGVGKTKGDLVRRDDLWKHPHGRGEDDRKTVKVNLRKETPPRAWGRHLLSAFLFSWRRNTPTGVGKTLAQYPRTKVLWKHPHGRGEDLLVLLSLLAG